MLLQDSNKKYPMITDSIKELALAKQKVAQLEEKVAQDMKPALAALPAQFGFDDPKAFAAAVLAACGKQRGRKPGSKNKAEQKRKRTRTTVTDEIRAGVKKLVAEEKTGAEIAQALKISVPTVQNIKKALGLVKKK